MFRVSVTSAVLSLMVFGTGLHAQGVEGIYDLGMIMGRTATMSLAVTGDSALVVVRMNVPDGGVRADTLRGTIKGNAVTINSKSRSITLKTASGDERTVWMSEQWVVTVTGDVVEGTIYPLADDPNIQMIQRSVKGKRIARE